LDRDPGAGEKCGTRRGRGFGAERIGLSAGTSADTWLGSADIRGAELVSDRGLMMGLFNHDYLWYFSIWYLIHFLIKWGALMRHMDWK
jgi:hypothetical protein